MNVQEAVLKRRSVRSYHEKSVSESDLDKIVNAGRWAPNAGAYAMAVIRDKDLMTRLNEKTLEAMLASGDEFTVGRASLPGYLPLYGAPAAIILSGPADAPLTPLNCAVAAENMLLQATELGLGSCFIRSLTHSLNKPANAKLAREAGIPEGYLMQCGVVFGYTDDETKFRRADPAPKGEVCYIG